MIASEYAFEVLSIVLVIVSVIPVSKMLMVQVQFSIFSLGVEEI